MNRLLVKNPLPLAVIRKRQYRSEFLPVGEARHSCPRVIPDGRTAAHLWQRYSRSHGVGETGFAHDVGKHRVVPPSHGRQSFRKFVWRHLVRMEMVEAIQVG